MSSLLPVYTPTFSPSLPPRHHKSLDPATSSQHILHVRQCYDIYKTCLGQGDIVRAKRAWALLMREGSLDWATSWREAYQMVSLRASSSDDDHPSTHVQSLSPDHYGALESRILQAEQYRLAKEKAEEKALVDLQIAFLRQVHAAHCRPVKKKRKKALREPVQILQELVLFMARKGRDTEALAELELSLAIYPYRDSQELHYYAGWLSIRIAQKQLLDEFPAMSAEQSTTLPDAIYPSTTNRPNKRQRSDSSSSGSDSSSSSSTSSSSTRDAQPEIAQASQSDTKQILSLLSCIMQDTAAGQFTLSEARNFFQRVLDIREAVASSAGSASQKMRECTASFGVDGDVKPLSRVEEDTIRWLHLLDGNDPPPRLTPAYAIPPQDIGPRGGKIRTRDIVRARQRSTSRASSVVSTAPSAASDQDESQDDSAPHDVRARMSVDESESGGDD